MTFKHITLAVKIQLLVIGIFTIFRLLLFFTCRSFITDADSLSDILQAFWIGFRFDWVVTSYIVLLPFLVLTVLTLSKSRSETPVKVIFWLLFVVFSLTFVICAIDIPYFGYFFTRLNTAAFQWMDTPLLVAKMIVREFRYIGYLIPLILLNLAFFWGLKRIFSTFMRTQQRGNIWLSVALSLCAAWFLFMGVRGGNGLNKAPFRINDAFFGTNSFLNQLNLNANYTLFWSLRETSKESKTLHLMDNEEALQLVRRSFSIETPDDCSPILRRITPDTTNTTPANVVLIFMESMSAARMSHFGNKQHLTPFLDSIAAEGYLFENIYSSGIHTHNGVFGTLFSFPTLYTQRAMRYATMSNYKGMASALKSHGYSTTFFATHEGQFDNIEEFLTANDFDRVVTSADYPPDKIVNGWGVTDDFMFDFSMPILAQRHAEQRPFLAVFLTVSNHVPYHIPKYFSPRQQNIKEQAVEYADWAMKKFMEMAAEQPWFDNTLFVFVADHGALLNDIYAMPLNYHHIPLIMYAPKMIPQAETFERLGGQIDIFPTTMQLLRLPYVNNTMGIDLLSEERSFVYFSSDQRYGVISDSLFLIVSQSNDVEGLFRYRTNDTTNYFNQYKTVAAEMRRYAEAHFQVAQYVVFQRMQGCE
ncbi:MAG: sulfatase-like hydrolase/transferase [Bacteroidales bacterium]|nr:sulfatase-like hydrolase/transferase [Bacteroidales bacterium]